MSSRSASLQQGRRVAANHAGANYIEKLDMRDKNIGRLPIRDSDDPSNLDPGAPKDEYAVADLMPVRGLPTTKQDQRMQNLAAMAKQGMFGPDKVMGQRNYTDAEYQYFEKKQRDARAMKFTSLLSRVFDSSDIDDAQRLNALDDSILRSRLDVVDTAIEQRRFLTAAAITMQASKEDYARLIAILGGAEELVVHPVLDAVSGAAEVGKGMMGGGLFGLFSVANDTQDPLTDTARARTLARRQQIAIYVLPLFPAIAKGVWKSADGSWQRIQDGGNAAGARAAKLVTLCESYCKNYNMLPLFMEKFSERAALGGMGVE
jgi:hypothetical protein